MNRVITLYFLLTLPLLAEAHDARAKYIGNEGVLVTSGETKVLFDAFYANSYGEYVLVAEPVSQAILDGQPPYDGIDALMVSHAHGDHFTAQPTLDYLRAQPLVVFIGPGQAVDALKAIAKPEDSTLIDRLVSFDLKPGQPPASFEGSGYSVAAVAIPHSGGASTADIDNLAFRVTLDQTPTVLHLGDATTDDDEFARQQTFWDARKIDTAFPPFWFYLERGGRVVLDQRIRAAQVIGIHVPAEAIGKGPAWRERMKGDLFTDPGEERIIRSSSGSIDAQ